MLGPRPGQPSSMGTRQWKPTPIVTPVLRTVSKQEQAGPNPNRLMGRDRVARSQEPGRIWPLPLPPPP